MIMIVALSRLIKVNDDSEDDGLYLFEARYGTKVAITPSIV